MRIYLPERISLQWATVFATAFLVLQMVQGTGYMFALLHLVFTLLWVHTFNTAGGFTRASGAYVFWFGIMTILLGTVTKAVIGEAADSHTWNGVALMGVYSLSMAVMLVAILVTRQVTQNVVSVAGRLRSYNHDFRNASIGCSVLGLSLPFILNVVPSGQGTIFSVVRQVNFFTEVGIILGTISVIESSGGKKCWGWLNAVPAGLLFLIGFSTFSKQGMFTWLLCWGVAVAYTRYKLNLLQFSGLLVVGLLMYGVLTPIAQVGRNLNQGGDWFSGFVVAKELITNLSDTREQYKEASINMMGASGGYFGQDVGLMARLTRIDSDDPLIAFSLQGHYIGHDALWYAFLNWFPHLVLPNKESYAPEHYGGNWYAHEMGWLPASDTTTGISFGAPAEAFHMGGYQSVILVQLLVWSLLFVSADLLCGDLRRAPWGLFLAMAFAHVAPEGAVLATVQFVSTGNFGLLMCMLFSTYGAPVIGAALTNAVARRSTGPASVEVGRFLPAASAAESR